MCEMESSTLSTLIPLQQASHQQIWEYCLACSRDKITLYPHSTVHESMVQMHEVWCKHLMVRNTCNAFWRKYKRQFKQLRYFFFPFFLPFFFAVKQQRFRYMPGVKEINPNIFLFHHASFWMVKFSFAHHESTITTNSIEIMWLHTFR